MNKKTLEIENIDPSEAEDLKLFSEKIGELAKEYNIEVICAISKREWKEVFSQVYILNNKKDISLTGMWLYALNLMIKNKSKKFLQKLNFEAKKWS